MIYSADDDVEPSHRLISLALDAGERALQLDLSSLDARQADGIGLANLWPGEHYRLLAGLTAALKAHSVVEIGTGTGLSSLALLSGMRNDGRIATFDIVPWQEYPGGVLRDEDFRDGRLTQFTDDLSEPDGGEIHRDLLAGAQLIFVDAAKDGEMERRFLDLFEAIEFTYAPVVVFDDIRLLQMLEIWRGVSRPKLDLTSLGHWSGTGLIDYS